LLLIQKINLEYTQTIAGEIIVKIANYPERITALWTAFLLGTLFHTQLGLMPLFHGQSIVESQVKTNIEPIFWGMLVFFALPMFALIAATFTDSRQYRQGHFWLTVVYSVLNSFHLVADLLVHPIAWYQIALMVILLIIGLLLNGVAYGWMRYRDKQPQLSSPAPDHATF
jgi:hypothetical protein